MKSEQNGQQFGWSLEQQFVLDVNWTTECCYGVALMLGKLLRLKYMYISSWKNNKCQNC